MNKYLVVNLGKKLMIFGKDKKKSSKTFSTVV